MIAKTAWSRKYRKPITESVKHLQWASSTFNEPWSAIQRYRRVQPRSLGDEACAEKQQRFFRLSHSGGGQPRFLKGREGALGRARERRPFRKVLSVRPEIAQRSRRGSLGVLEFARRQARGEQRKNGARDLLAIDAGVAMHPILNALDERASAS